MYKVLILDEDRGARYMLKRFPWSRYGFEISEEAAGGREALAKLASESVDLVVTDVRMPDMDGMDFLAAVHEQEVRPCLILLSSYNDFEYAQQGIGFGVFDYITKPFSEAAFGQTLQRAGIYLQKNGGEAAGSALHKSPSEAGEISRQAKILENLLLAGDPQFLPRCAAFAEKCREEGFLLQLTERLQAAFDERFPWVRCIEAERLDGKSVQQESFVKRAAALFGLLEKYELLQEKSLLRDICRLVWQDIEANLSLHLIASKLGISTDYAGRIFRHKTGMHFVAFVTRMKMERGKVLLSRGHSKNYEISERLGYSNPDYFRQLFKAHTGMTPTEYRNACRRQMFR